jgi:hypothetical protein
MPRTTFDDIPKAKAIWALALPTVPPPDDATFFRWLNLFTLADFEKGCLRIAKTGRQGRPYAPTQSLKKFHAAAKTAMYRERDLRLQRSQAVSPAVNTGIIKLGDAQARTRAVLEHHGGGTDGEHNENVE